MCVAGVAWVNADVCRYVNCDHWDNFRNFLIYNT